MELSFSSASSGESGSTRDGVWRPVNWMTNLLGEMSLLISFPSLSFLDQLDVHLGKFGRAVGKVVEAERLQDVFGVGR